LEVRPPGVLKIEFEILIPTFSLYLRERVRVRGSKSN
jgi:hypothetical protein